VDAGASGKAQLLCALAIVVALGLLLALGADGAATDPPAGAAQAAAAAPSGEADSPDLARLSVRVEPRVARRVEAIRGLRFARIPKPEVVDGDYLNRLSEREARRTGAHRGIGTDEAELRILGLLAPDEQLESILGSTGDLAAAAYDTHTDRLYVVSDAVAANKALVEFVLAHELTHALEDQRFGLRGGRDLDDDAALALAALHEGSATSMMVAYASEHLSATDLIAGSAAVSSDTGDVPRFFVDQLLWTYTGGARFVEGLRRLAGSWKLVDYALQSRPPATTEQVLHVDKYVHGEAPLPVGIETAALSQRGWRRADRGVIGELSTSQLLELGSDHQAAQRAAAGWGGDVYELWRRGPAPQSCADPCRSDLVLVADWRSDSDRAAARLQDGLSRYLEAGLGGERAEPGVWILDGGFAAISAVGDETVLVFAPEAETAVAVAEDQVAAAGVAP
jgi:hypothetical protein